MTARSRIRSVTPLFVVADLHAALAFYCGKLGFSEPSLHGEPPCFAMIRREGFEIMLSRAEDPAHVRPNGALGTWDAYVNVVDLAAEIAALGAAGVALATGPRDTFYGMREIEVLDPDGHRLCFGQDTSGDPGHVTQTFDGVLDLGPAKLRLVLKLAVAGEGCVAWLDSPDQGAFDLPIDVVTRAGSALRFEMRAIQAAFEGTFDADARVLTGRWTQRGRSWPLTLSRV